ncbi:MAG TPA: 2Fe-2S iron-sulfur cluster-binding protein [Caulobacteraceae bacterium]|jgi:sarcosine oxidase subunit alpha
MSGPSRAAQGGLVDRARTIKFSFDGQVYEGHPGDTLASALLANGVSLMGRSFKYHRPRGVLAAGVEEPNALVGAGTGGRYEPNTRASDLFLYDGLVAVSQNRWPSLAFDVGALNSLIARFIPAGFYYKTFIGPPWLWKLYEHVIRRAAGLGAAPTEPEVDAFEHRAAFCDVLVAGAGPAGLAAALAAARGGARVILAEQDARLGGSLLGDEALIDGLPALDWIARTEAQLAQLGARVLKRTTAMGYYDHNQLTLIERRVEAGQAPGASGLAQRLWRVRAGRVILAQGAIERPILFSNNDQPGVILAGAAKVYARRYGVLPGRRVVVATNNDEAYAAALALADAGCEIVAILDSRSAAGSAIVAAARARFAVHLDADLISAKGAKQVTGAEAVVAGKPLSLEADLIAASGGFTPVVHLHMQAGGTLDWNETTGAFTPAIARQGQVSVGACAGREGLSEVLADGWLAGELAAAAAPSTASQSPSPKGGGIRTEGATAIAPPSGEGDQAQPDGGGQPRAQAKYDGPTNTLAHWTPAPGVNLKTAFVDPQNDVTAADLDLAWREGYRSVEHLKRYTTLGMATDQGKTSNLIGLARLAQAEGRPVPEVGLTTFRPPYTPTTLAALAGEATGQHMAPLRRTPLYTIHAAHNPPWQPVGYWQRPRAYPRAGETLAQAGLREARSVRTAVGMIDVSTLGKFEIAGPDAAALIERVCATPVAKLAVGRGRYTVMLREDGMVVDDGTVWRLGEQRYLLTSSTGGGDRMVGHLSYVRKILEPGYKVAVASVQERWGAVAVAGPLARAALAGLDLEPPAHMGLVRGQIGGLAVLVLAASYSGERAFEIYAPSHDLPRIWAVLQDAVTAHGGGLYGLEALELLRIEKGHIETGAEIDGRHTPGDLGLTKALRAKGGFVGAPALARPALSLPDRQRLVGLEAEDGGAIPEGAMLLSARGRKPEGHVTSAGRRVTAKGDIALGLLSAGPERVGETLLASSPTRGRTVRVSVVAPIFYDPEGARYRD